MITFKSKLELNKRYPSRVKLNKLIELEYNRFKCLFSGNIECITTTHIHIWHKPKQKRKTKQSMKTFHPRFSDFQICV